jgi:hypothetical protein
MKPFQISARSLIPRCPRRSRRAVRAGQDPPGAQRNQQEDRQAQGRTFRLHLRCTR